MTQRQAARGPISHTAAIKGTTDEEIDETIIRGKR